ncbi:hypothetical protein [Kitasatospora sp. NPDC056181]|uniref:hypothetical protein n=1 Tax=Kitasatospora sp. NPDC056181 TaxID=3345737 RepID=UPI0035D7D3D8
MNAALEEFVHQGFEYAYPGQWQNWTPGFACSAVISDVGLLAILTDDQLKFTSGVATNLPYSQQLVAEVGEINRGTAFGALTLHTAPDSPMSLITYNYAVSPAWMEVDSQASAQLIIDVIKNIPRIVNLRAEHLMTRFGGERWPIDDGWQAALVLVC